MNILVEIGGELSEPSEVERLLGAQVHMNLKWGEMIQSNDKAGSDKAVVEIQSEG